MANAVVPPILMFPRASLEQSAITSLRQRSNKAAQALARGGSTIANITARQGRPTDINNTQTPTGVNILARLSNPVALTANVYATDVFPNFTTQQTQGVCIHEFTTLSAVPFIDEITIYVASLKVAVIPLAELYAQGGAQSKTGFFFDPILVPAQTHCRFDLLSSVNLPIGQEQFGIGFYFGEAWGVTVNPQDQVLNDLVGQYDQGNLVVR